jgi:hypothetical protein
MKSALVTAAFDSVFGALGLMFDRGPDVKPARAGAKRAAAREGVQRKARTTLYAACPKPTPTRQLKRQAARIWDKAEASQQKIVARRERAQAKRQRKQQVKKAA